MTFIKLFNVHGITFLFLFIFKYTIHCITAGEYKKKINEEVNKNIIKLMYLRQNVHRKKIVKWINKLIQIKAKLNKKGYARQL